MTEQSMVEKVARAIADRDSADGVVTEWESLPAIIKEDCRRAARAAIGAMREPTEAMEMAGWVAIKDIDIPEAHTAKAWGAMLDEALK